MARLMMGTVAAAGVNSQVMENYARREKIKYRVLYTSEPYLNLPVMANPRVSHDKVEKVRQALLLMAKDVEGNKILQTASDMLKSEQRLGFVSAENKDYDNYRHFYQNTLVRE